MIKRQAVEWKTRLHDAQIGHYVLAEKYKILSEVCGVIITFLTVIITALTFYNNQAEVYRYCFSVLCIIATSLSAYQSFYKPGQKSEVHRSQAARYGGLKRSMERLIISSHLEIEAFESKMEDIQKEWDAVAGESPLTSFKTLKEIRHKKNELLKSAEGRFTSTPWTASLWLMTIIYKTIPMIIFLILILR
ncbi:MAG: SLATT domain-containing protein [Desulfovibrio sp.]